MPLLTEATIEERVVHYTRHIRRRIALSIKLRAALPVGHDGVIAESARLANLEAVLADLADILEGNAPRYTTEEEI